MLEVGFASPSLGVVLGAGALEARNFLLTDTALKVVGFLAVEPVRTWFLSPSLAFPASVSDPPLALALAESTLSSTWVMCLFSSSSWLATPFTAGDAASTSLAELFCALISVG